MSYFSDLLPGSSLLGEHCNGCRKPLLLRNLFVDDGCPCNAKFGINIVPRDCSRCKTKCVKPGHHIEYLFNVDHLRPPFNHTREDSPLNPCAVCINLMTREQLIAYAAELKSNASELKSEDEVIEMVLFCPMCQTRHLDEGKFAMKLHHTHACQSCGFVWRPAKQYTIGVQFLKGFKNP